MIREALEGEAFEVECFSSAERALCALATSPLLLITDVELPGAPGLELLTAMRHRLPELPVIVVSGNATKLGEARRRGAASVPKKPFPLETLKRLVKHALPDESEPRDHDAIC